MIIGGEGVDSVVDIGYLRESIDNEINYRLASSKTLPLFLKTKS